IQNSGTNYDLINFKGKWYAPWGVLPALFLTPLQLIKGSFVPAFYLNIFFSSLDSVVFYLILLQIKRDFLPQMNKWVIFIAVVLFSFGTTHFYVGTLGSSWHVDQMVTNLFGTLGIYVIFRKKREFKHYFLSILIFSIALIGRGTIVLLSILPAALYVWEVREGIRKIEWRKDLLIGIAPLFFITLFFLYNYVRFQDPFDYGYSYINEAPYLQVRREAYGDFSLKHLPYNLRYMLLEIPHLKWEGEIKLNFNLKGNSIFFLSPPLLAAFLALRKGLYQGILWLTAVITILPSLLIYSTGWMLFGYRYSLDITAILVILSLFGIKGRLNCLYVLGTLFAVYMHWLGINALM
ncbi:MAG: hypothetical protein ACE5GL_05875, partial [Calditrichia bacterium]